MAAEAESPGQGPGWRVKYRYRAVMEVLDGSPVSEVVIRCGVSRQSVYSWRDRYAAAGIDGLRDISRRPRPSRLPAEVEALVCELRRTHPAGRPADRVRGSPAWHGPRAVAGDGAPGMLERNGMVVP